MCDVSRLEIRARLGSGTDWEIVTKEDVNTLKNDWLTDNVHTSPRLLYTC